MPHIQIQAKTPAIEILQTFLEHQGAFAKEMQPYHPDRDEIAGSTDLNVVIDADIRHPAPYGESLFGQFEIPIRKLPPGYQETYRKYLLDERQNEWLREPDPRYCRTPGKGYEGRYHHYLEMRRLYTRFGQIVTEIHYSEESPATQEMLQEMEACQYMASHGWFRPALMASESELNGRWRYWLETRDRGSLLKTPIPRIDWMNSPHPSALEHLYWCLDHIYPQWIKDGHQRWKAVNYFFEWLLWSFGDPMVKERPVDHWDGRAHDRLVQIFTPIPLLAAPYDYFGQLLLDLSDYRCPIPDQISMAQAKATVDNLFDRGFAQGAKKQNPKGFNSVDYRTTPFFDLETGSGRILLAASNYSFRGTGFNIGLDTKGRSMGAKLLTMAAKLNFWLYTPEQVMPHSFIDYCDLQRRVTWESLTFTIAKSKGIDPEAYFKGHQMSPNWKDWLPIIQLAKRNRAAKINTQSQGVSLNVQQPTATIQVKPQTAQINAAPAQPQLQSTPQPVQIAIQGSEGDRAALPSAQED